MSIFATEYSNYMTYLYDYNKKMIFLKSLFVTSHDFFKTSNTLNRNFALINKQFPKFPYFFNIISSLNGINLIEIMNCSMDNTDQLLLILHGSNALGSKKVLDEIPNDINEMILHFSYQYSFLADPINYYNFGLYGTPYLYEIEKNRNDFSNLFTSTQYDNSGKLQKTSFILEHATYCLMHSLITSQFNLNLGLYQQTLMPSANNIKRSDFSNYFSNFLIDNQLDISLDLTGIISNIVFNFDNINNSVMNNIRIIITDNLLYNPISNMLSSFSNFINDKAINEPQITLFSNLVNSLNSHLAAKYTSEFFNNTNNNGVLPDIPLILESEFDRLSTIDSITSISELTSLLRDTNTNLLSPDDTNIVNSIITKTMIFENNAIKNYFSKMNNMNIQEYLFLLFLYKFWPNKFINTIQLIMKEFTEMEIKTTETSDNLFSIDEEYKEVILNFICSDSPAYSDKHQDINFTKLSEYMKLNFFNLNFNLEPNNNNLLSEIVNNKLIEFSCTTYYLQLIDGFIKSDDLNNFIKDLLNNIFIYLRDTGYVAYNFDWYSKHESILIYLKSNLQLKLYEDINKLFQEPTEVMKTLVNNLFTSDNIESLFSSDNPTFKNSVDQDEIKKYYLQKFLDLINSPNIVKNMHNSVESFTLSALTKNLFLGVLTNYLN